MESQILGIDIGGTGIKGAIVDTNKGQLLSDRFKVSTPSPSSPLNVLDAVRQVISLSDYKGQNIGFGFPAIVDKGQCKTASNISEKWIGINLNNYFSEHLSKKCIAINDADAAGIAEVQYSQLSTDNTTIILLTLGTGIGSAIFRHGHLLPNSELGHLKFKGTIAEKYASNKVRVDQELNYQQWGSNLNEFLQHIEHLFSPDHIIIGGGVSKKMNKYSKYLNTKCKLSACSLLNNAGIIGAALNVSRQ